MDGIVELRKKQKQLFHKNKGFQLNIKKSSQKKSSSQDSDKLNDFLEDLCHENPLNFMKDNDQIQDIDKDIKQLNASRENPKMVNIEEEQTGEKSPDIWRMDGSNQLSPTALLSYESNINNPYNMTSGEVLFKEGIYDDTLNRQIAKTEKDEDCMSQNFTSDPNKEIQSPQTKMLGSNFTKHSDSTIRKNRSSQISVIDRLRERQRDQKAGSQRSNNQELQSQIFKKLKQKKTLLKLGTQTDKNDKSAFSFLSHMKKINILKRFQNKMKSNITKSDLDSLTRFQLQLVNDKSHLIQNLNSKITWKDIKDKLKWLFSVLTRKNSYSPDSPFFILWKGILIITYLLTIFDVPLQFLNKYSENDSLINLVMFLYIPILVFIFEIILNFNTGFYREGQIVEDKQQIFENYVEFQFWLDTVSVCGFGISQVLPYAKVLFLIRIYNLFLQLRQFEDRAQFTQRFPSFWTLLKLFTLIFCVAHFCGCGFSIIAYLEQQHDSDTFTWHRKYNIVDEDWRTHYIYSLYFSFITMITVGYGDIVPQTNIERVYVIFMTLISAAVFGYSVNTIGAIFQDIAAKSSNYRILKRDIGYYMRSRDIDSQLQVKVNQYLSYYHLEAQQEHQQTEEVLNKLSNDLKLQIKKNYFGKALSTSYFLTSNFSPQLIIELTFKAKEAFYRKGDHVFSRNDNDQRLLIITKGVCELSFYHPTLNEIQLFKIDKGDVGSKGFMTGQPREVTLKTLSHCTFAYITIDEFVETIKQFPADYEKFCMLKDSMILYESESQSKLHCYSCQKSGHGVMNCPSIHFRKSKEIIIQKHLFSPQQQRLKHKRKGEKEKILLNLEFIKNDLKSYRLDVIQSLKKDEDDLYEELIIKKDKDFYMETQCFSYNIEIKSYIIDPKEAYLYPDDNDEESLDELEEEDESENSLSDYQGSIVLQEQIEKKSIKLSHPEFIRKSARQSTVQAKMLNYQGNKKVSYNLDSFTNFQADQNVGTSTPKSQKSQNDKEPKENLFNMVINRKLFEGEQNTNRSNLMSHQQNFKLSINNNDPQIFVSQSKTNLDKLEKKQKALPLKQTSNVSQQKDLSKGFGYMKSKTAIGSSHNTQNNSNLNNNINNNVKNINKSFNSAENSININNFNQKQQLKYAFEQAPMLKIETIQPPTQQSYTPYQQQQPNLPQRKSVMYVHPHAIFASDGPIIKSLALSQGERFTSKILDYRRSAYLAGQFDPFLYGITYPEMPNMQEMIYYTDFDIAREYTIYFPNGNYTNVVKSVKNKQRVKISTQKTKQTEQKKTKLGQTATQIDITSFHLIK